MRGIPYRDDAFDVIVAGACLYPGRNDSLKLKNGKHFTNTPSSKDGSPKRKDKAMGFKENLLNKMAIDKLAVQVAASVEPQADAAKFDKDAARRLIELGGFPHVELEERDLDLYILEDDGEKKKIIVLDNGLAIYNTTIDDVAMRKSPTVKEMVNFRNARKILSDSDVRTSKRTDSVHALKRMLIRGIDLTYTEKDIDGIVYDGAASLEENDRDGVLECLALFSELLGFPKHTPKIFQPTHCEARGEVGKGSAGAVRLGPGYIYDKMQNTLKFIRLEDDLEHYLQIVRGEVSADAEGVEVFKRLKQLVMDRKPVLGESV